MPRLVQLIFLQLLARNLKNVACEVKDYRRRSNLPVDISPDSD